MTNLQNYRLTFTLPSIGKQVRDLFERELPTILLALQSEEERRGLLAEMESRWGFQRLSPTQQHRLRERANSLTVAHIEAAVRQKMGHAAGLDDEPLARMTIEFQRTLRIPDDGKTYPLPAGLGLFPLHSVDDFPKTIPAAWMGKGGVMMPMHQSEALWISFSARYPFAVKIAAGKINAVSGEAWTAGLERTPQNYLVVPEQPWLDGFSVGSGLIRQFVAMPLGAGYSVEEQLTGQADVGGLQLQVFPLSAVAYYREKVEPALPASLQDLLDFLLPQRLPKTEPSRMMRVRGPRFMEESMGLGAGGKMQQEIYADEREFADWDQSQTSRCFVHLCNSTVWRQMTGTNPPHPPLTAKEYQQAEIPWFDYYRDDLKPIQGSERLAGVKSVAQLGQEKNNQPLPGNQSATPELIVQYGNSRRPGEIRDFFDTP